MKIIYSCTRFFFKQRQAEIGKKSSNSKQHPEAEVLLFENGLCFYDPKIGHILKNKQRNKCLCPWDYTINYNENEDEGEKYIT